MIEDLFNDLINQFKLYSVRIKTINNDIKWFG